MIHYVYKILNSAGEFYIGRHSTSNLEDGYMGSGKWVNSIDKSTLTKEILVYADTFDQLVLLEEEYISKHFKDSNCKNIKLASVGWTPEDARRVALQQIRDGKNALTGERGSRLAKETNKKRFANGTHPFQIHVGTARAAVQKMIEDGTHPFSGDNGRKRIQEQITNGTHPGSIVFAKEHICPHCNKTGKGAVMFRHHYNNCKSAQKMTKNPI